MGRKEITTKEDLMKVIEIRNKYLNFFKNHGHKVVPSAPLIPENDPSVLFTTAGMQPLVPYLLGEKHPEGTRLTNYQKCVRTNDIEEVGDNRHLTYFEMLGNWSLGDYFKEESIQMSFDFLTKELQIPVEKLSVTCFAGDEDCPRDTVSAGIWKKAGIPEERIYFYGKDDNWWIAGEEGPCGPDTEMFYDTGKPACSADCQPSCDCGKYVEIWNNVFMEYFKDKNGYSKLKQQNVDTGLGLERMAMLLQGKETPFDTELFSPIMEKLEELQKIDSIESRRIIAEHLRSSMMIISDGGRPSNLDRGYVLRRLIRRMIRHLNKLQIDLNELTNLIELNVENLKEMYPALEENKEIIKATILSAEELTCQTQKIQIQLNENTEIKTKLEITVLHDMQEATCTEGGNCKVEGCTYIEEALGHNYENGVCTNCGDEEEKLEITSEKYNIENQCITKIQLQTTVKELKEQIQTNATEINVYNSNKELQEDVGKLATGMQIELKFKEKIETLTIIVQGDIDGDGEIKLSDMSIINRFRLNKKNLEGAHLSAADVTGDGVVDFKDLVKINRYRLNKITEL